jgi:hypothetical protein
MARSKQDGEAIVLIERMQGDSDLATPLTQRKIAIFAKGASASNLAVTKASSGAPCRPQASTPNNFSVHP